jgi:hypothetical protein
MNEDTHLMTEDISAAIEAIKETVEEFRKAALRDQDSTGWTEEKVSSAFAPLGEAVELLRSQLEDFDSKKTKPESAAFKIMQSLSAVDAQITYAEAALQPTPPSVEGLDPASQPGPTLAMASPLASLVSRLRGMLSGLSGRIWQILATILTVKEWSVKGAVSTPALVGFFGVAGNVELSVTFNP